MILRHTLTFHADGTATTLWTDQLNLAELGRLRVERASTIEFNDAGQEWEVRLVSTDDPERVHFSHASRAECLRWEHDYFNV